MPTSAAATARTGARSAVPDDVGRGQDEGAAGPVQRDPGTQAPKTRRSVAIVSLGCARNDVDSEELAGRLDAQGWQLEADPAQADVAVVNTCGFVEQAKKDSIDAILGLADLKSDGSRTRAVVAVGCLAERYGEQLAQQLPEADAVLGFDTYGDLSTHLSAILDGRPPASHVPRDRRTLLPLAPAARQPAAIEVALPGHQAQGGQSGFPAGGAAILRTRLDDKPWAPLKIASGCDRRCSFCAIPAFRGSFVSRPPEQVVAEARWLAEHGVREVLLVSENSTSYGKDLGDLRLLERLLADLARVDGLDVIRVSYLQPAELRPDLIAAMTCSDRIAPYFDLSFQHASGPLLRRMRRFGDREAFLALIESIRACSPAAGIRSNVIVGFPGETEEDYEILSDFLDQAHLDAVGVFGYSSEEGTEAAELPGALTQEVIAQRVEDLSSLVDSIVHERAAARIGELVDVLIEEVQDEDGVPVAYGRAAHQGPEVDGDCRIELGGAGGAGAVPVGGQLVTGRVVGNDGADLHVWLPLLGAGEWSGLA
ncbi:MAG: 30S ribosomal protein S12 methylthiotransferase RimO [Micrococcales bacterium]|nr:30S ribosomal protein S12 methylthiotransferase RimO [Micrococcales bacterium]